MRTTNARSVATAIAVGRTKSDGRSRRVGQVTRRSLQYRARKQSAAPAPEPLAYARGTVPVFQHWRVITRDVMIPALWVLKSRAI